VVEVEVAIGVVVVEDVEEAIWNGKMDLKVINPTPSDTMVQAPTTMMIEDQDNLDK